MSGELITREENKRALAAFLFVLLYAALAAILGCGRFAPAIANPLSSESHWFWDCPGNPIGNPPGCYEVSPCGELVEHPLEMCCPKGGGSAGAYWAKRLHLGAV